jgi:glutamyl/glutaminyl-tRNA synthetase
MPSDLPELRHCGGFGGRCHLRFDDTIDQGGAGVYRRHRGDVRWLGFDWGKNLFHASDYFDSSTNGPNT